MTSGPGQVRSAQMAAYPAMLPYRSGWTALQEANPEEAARQGMVEGEGSAIDLLRQAGSTSAGSGAAEPRGVERLLVQYKNA